VITALLIVLALPALAAAGYLTALTLASRVPRPPAPAGKGLRFDVVVPAHDEEAGIERTVRSLLAVDWPADRFRVLVVADNCCDATAERAAAAGAIVLVREDAERRGKGYALEMAFGRVLADGRANASVVVDADTLVSPGLLAAFATRLASGAAAVQGRYAVSNPDAAWRTCLMSIAFAIFHDVRSLGRERLGLSCGLRGNGMCLSTDLIRRVPPQAYSIVEDVEYGIRLGQAGTRVHYAHEAVVRGEMVGGERESRSQRARWEGGRRALARTLARPTLREGFARRDRVLVDLAVDLIVPPLSAIVLYAGLGLAVALAHPGLGAWAVAPWALAVILLVLHVARGWQLSGTGLQGLGALARAPVYVAWKLARVAVGRGSAKDPWVRTARETDPPPRESSR
jgi:hypothetical protein